MYLKRWNPNCNGNRRDKVALKAICMKNVKFKLVKIRTGGQYLGYLYYSENLNWAAQNLQLGRGLDIASLNNMWTKFTLEKTAKYAEYSIHSSRTKKQSFLKIKCLGISSDLRPTNRHPYSQKRKMHLVLLKVYFSANTCCILQSHVLRFTAVLYVNIHPVLGR